MEILLNAGELGEALDEMRDSGGAARMFLDEALCDSLVSEVSQLPFRVAQPKVGSVTQDFSIALNVSKQPLLSKLTQRFEAILNDALAARPDQSYETPFAFNDQAVMIYEKGSQGITPHRDHIDFEALVAIVTIAGQADFYLCDDREKTNSRKFSAVKGQLILMRAVNYAGIRNRPFHYVDNIIERRIAIGWRYNMRPENTSNPDGRKLN